MVLEWAQTKTDRGMRKGKRKNEDFVELQQCEDEDGCAWKGLFVQIGYTMVHAVSSLLALRPLLSIQPNEVHYFINHFSSCLV